MPREYYDDYDYYNIFTYLKNFIQKNKKSKEINKDCNENKIIINQDLHKYYNLIYKQYKFEIENLYKNQYSNFDYYNKHNELIKVLKLLLNIINDKSDNDFDLFYYKYLSSFEDYYNNTTPNDFIIQITINNYIFDFDSLYNLRIFIEKIKQEEIIEVPKIKEIIELPKKKEIVEVHKKEKEIIELPKKEKQEIVELSKKEKEIVELPKKEKQEIVKLPKKEIVELLKKEIVELPKKEIVELPKKEIIEIPKIKEINNKKRKKQIPAAVKRLVWNTYIGEEIGKAKCRCCNITDITQLSFHCGHIIAEANGGEIKVSNLKPICQNCNLSMGTKNMQDFIKLLK